MSDGLCQTADRPATVKQHLDDLRCARAGYSVVAYGDAAARLVLRASHDKTYRREYLDQLCDQAAECFRLIQATAALSDHDPHQQAEYANQALLHSNGVTTVFARLARDADDFLCIVQQPSGGKTTPLEQLFHDAHATLTLITGQP